MVGTSVVKWQLTKGTYGSLLASFLLVYYDDVNHPSLVVVPPCREHQHIHYSLVGTMVVLVFL